MTERNNEGQLTSASTDGGLAPTHGIIDHIRNLDARIQRIEDKLWPKVEDGSGTGRYVDHWTQTGDGTDYPKESYGTGELKPFVPFEPADDLAVGDTVRVIEGNGEVNPEARKVTSIEDLAGGKTVFVEGGDQFGYPRGSVTRVIAPEA